MFSLCLLRVSLGTFAATCMLRSSGSLGVSVMDCPTIPKAVEVHSW